jgi:hypothetical protein
MLADADGPRMTLDPDDLAPNFTAQTADGEIHVHE